MIMPATDVHVQVNLYGDLDDTCQLSIRNVTHNYDMQRLANSHSRHDKNAAWFLLRS